MMPVAILAGGLGTRLGALSQDRPKSLVVVAGKPFIWHQLNLLRAAGAGLVFVLASHMIEQIHAELARASVDGFQVEVLADDPPLAGTAGALRPLAERLKAPFFVLYGDSYLNCDYEWIETRFRRSKKLSLMVVCRAPSDSEPNATLQRGIVTHYNKHRRLESMWHIDYGLNVLTPEALTRFPYYTDLADVQTALARTGQLAGLEWPERYYSIGSPSGLALTEAVIRSRMAQASK